MDVVYAMALHRWLAMDGNPVINDRSKTVIEPVLINKATERCNCSSPEVSIHHPAVQRSVSG
jgi:hypothetical protein